MQFASKISVLLRPWQAAAPCQEEMAGGTEEQGRRDQGTAPGTGAEGAAIRGRAGGGKALKWPRCYSGARRGFH